jgi:hypothetical protein
LFAEAGFAAAVLVTAVVPLLAASGVCAAVPIDVLPLAWVAVLPMPFTAPVASVSPVVPVVPWLSSRLPTTAPSASTAPAATPVRARRVALDLTAGR